MNDFLAIDARLHQWRRLLQQTENMVYLPVGEILSSARGQGFGFHII